MKKIVKGNDFIMRIPVMKIVDGEKQAFPLPGCTDIVVRLCSAFRRYELTHTIDAKDDNVLLARVEGDKIPLGTYALEVRGKIFGNDWRSDEYEHVAIVDRNADADTELGETDEGENSVEMDTAVVVLPPDRELEALVKEAQAQNKAMSELSDTIKVSEEGRAKSEESRVQAELTRVSQEAERVQAEGTRTKTEIGREANELTRKSNEAKRQDNETARQVAEEKRESDATSAINTMQAKTDDAVKVMQTKTDTATASMDEHKAAFDNAEAARAGNEEARVAAETARAEAESERTEQEQARQAAEARRAEAEGKREESNAKIMADYEATMSAVKAYLSEAETVSVSAEEIEMEANKYYDITLASTNTLTLTLQATDDTTHAHDYEGGFDTDDNAVPTVTWPEGVQWADMPVLKYGRHYEFNIRDVGGKKYGVVYVWDKE